MLVRTRTFLPSASSASLLRAIAPNRHSTRGSGEPEAVHVMLASPPGITSTDSGFSAKKGGTLRTARVRVAA